jgi:hypothetical protein
LKEARVTQGGKGKTIRTSEGGSKPPPAIGHKPSKPLKNLGLITSCNLTESFRSLMLSNYPSLDVS